VVVIAPPRCDKLSLDKPLIVWYIVVMKDKEPTYTLWNGSHMVATYPHTSEGMDDAMEQAHDLTIGGYGKLTIYSSLDDLVWSNCDDEPVEVECRMTDVEADADTLASAGYGTDEDYGYYGEDDVSYDY